mgnify:FL=1
MRSQKITKLISAVHNRLPSREIPQDASKDEKNWFTFDGKIQLIPGKQILGVEGVAGKCNNIWPGIRNDGTKVLYVKYGDKIGYWNGTTLVSIITGLTVDAEYSFQNYTSLAGNFTYAMGPDGIYKLNNGSIGSYINMYDSTKNFKGKAMLIDKGRMFVVGVEKDPTGLYGSKIDGQATNYSIVSNENIGTGDDIETTFTGTLAFKGGNPLSMCFGLQITAGSVSGKDDYNGKISGTGIATGSINYVTGAFSITFANPVPNATAITINYLHENSNLNGITDFTKSTPRIAGDGYVVRQDEGGDPIQNISIGQDGAYYSGKLYSFYRFYIDETDTKPVNEIFRKDIGIPNKNMILSIGAGIIFMNTANPEKPELTLLDKNPIGDNLVPQVLFAHFKFENYKYDKGSLITWGRFILVSCRSIDSDINDTLLLCDKSANTVDITSYGMNCIMKDGEKLYGGSELTQTVWQLFKDFDDDSYPIINYWDSKDENYGVDELKKTRNLIVMGEIDRYQQIEVHIGYDEATSTLVGTIRGDGSYVDKSKPSTVGGGLFGNNTFGGKKTSTIYPFLIQIKLKPPKYQTRVVRFVAKSIGHASINYIGDKDILLYEQKIAKRYRLKQNVSLDGSLVDQ